MASNNQAGYVFFNLGGPQYFINQTGFRLAFNLTSQFTDLYLRNMAYNMSTIAELWNNNGNLGIKLSVNAYIQGLLYTGESTSVLGSIPLGQVMNRMRVFITGGMVFQGDPTRRNDLGNISLECLVSVMADIQPFKDSYKANYKAIS